MLARTLAAEGYDVEAVSGDGAALASIERSSPLAPEAQTRKDPAR